MLITDPSLLEKYSTANRRWQGIPGIEVTPKGRMFCTFYSGTSLTGFTKFTKAICKSTLYNTLNHTSFKGIVVVKTSIKSSFSTLT